MDLDIVVHPSDAHASFRFASTSGTDEIKVYIALIGFSLHSIAITFALEQEHRA